MNDTLQKNLNYKKFIIDDRLQYFKPHSSKIEKTFAEEISFSLNRTGKFISPKFFYDKKGSDLFEKICTLPEYYPTKTEIMILNNLKDELPSYLNQTFRVVELGSGASVKTRIILDIFSKLYGSVEYFPIDISEILAESSEDLLRDYENLHITGIIDTYEGGLEFLKDYDDKKNLILFLGSSFGNFPPKDGYEFLQK
nr:L-histidine N(alpha)-methyltransferase [Nitrosopumilus adriaticus]